MQRSIFLYFESLINPFSTKREIDFNPNELGIVQVVRKVFGPLSVYALIGAALSISEVLLYALVGTLVDATTSTGDASKISTSVGWSILAIIVARPIIATVYTLVSEQAIQANLSALVRWSAHRKVLTKPIDFFDDRSSGDIASKVWVAGQAVMEAVAITLQMLWANVVFVLTSVALLAYVDWTVSVVIVLWIALYLLIAKLVVPETKRRAKAAAAVSARINGDLNDIYSNARLVKLYDPTGSNDSAFRQRLELFIGHTKSFLRIVSTGRVLLSGLNSAAFLTISLLLYSGFMSGSLGMGSIAMVLAIVIRLEGQLSLVLGQLTSLFRALGSFHSSEETLHVTEGRTLKPTLTDKRRIREVCCEGVRLEYREGLPVLDSVSFNFQHYEHVGIVGASGSGKSSMCSLLSGLISPTAGRVIVKDFGDLEHDMVQNCGSVDVC